MTAVKMSSSDLTFFLRNVVAFPPWGLSWFLSLFQVRTSPSSHESAGFPQRC